MAYNWQSSDFDLKLAIECTTAFSIATGIGCTLSNMRGDLLHEFGSGCNSCRICECAGRKETCSGAHASGTAQAGRLGGKYIYLCPLGLGCFACLIEGTQPATITVGPFLMVDLEDYVAYDLRNRLSLPEDTVRRVAELAVTVPYISPQKVRSLLTVLLMQVSYISGFSASSHMVELQELDAIQNQVNHYVLECKGMSGHDAYPISTEKKLLVCMAESDKPKAQKLLNKLLGHILFESGGDLDLIKAKTYELLVIISRAAMDAGVSSEQAMRMNHRFWRHMQTSENIDGLCVFLTGIMNRYIDSIFDLTAKKCTEIADMAAEYMRLNCVKKITLEDVAKVVYLSPTYFSKVFKKEMGCSFSHYLNVLRIEKSKEILQDEHIRLGDVAASVGFEDQSYFTKVFTRISGTTPGSYRKVNCRN